MFSISVYRLNIYKFLLEQILFFVIQILKMKKALFILAAAIVSVSSLKAQKVEVITSNKPGWHKIGETTVDFKTDLDKVLIVGADNFKAIKLKATDAPVHIENLEVVYGNGDPEQIPIRFDFKAGSDSRQIDLKGKDRKVKQINLVYRTVPNWKGDKAHVEIWGLK